MRETKSEVIKLIAFVANLVLITSNFSQFSWTFDLRASYCFDRTDSCSSGGGGLHNLLKENRLDWGAEIPLGGQQPGVLCPEAGPHVPIHSLSPGLVHTEKELSFS